MRTFENYLYGILAGVALAALGLVTGGLLAVFL